MVWPLSEKVKQLGVYVSETATIRCARMLTCVCAPEQAWLNETCCSTNSAKWEEKLHQSAGTAKPLTTLQAIFLAHCAEQQGCQLSASQRPVITTTGSDSIYGSLSFIQKHVLSCFFLQLLVAHNHYCTGRIKPTPGTLFCQHLFLCAPHPGWNPAGFRKLCESFFKHNIMIQHYLKVITVCVTWAVYSQWSSQSDLSEQADHCSWSRSEWVSPVEEEERKGLDWAEGKLWNIQFRFNKCYPSLQNKGI